MKKAISILLILALCLGLGGCKADPSPKEDGDKNAVVIRILNSCSESPINIAVRYSADGTVLGTMGLNARGGDLKKGETYALTLQASDLPDTIDTLTLELFAQTEANADYIPCGSGSISSPALGNAYEVTLTGSPAAGFVISSSDMTVQTPAAESKDPEAPAESPVAEPEAPALSLEDLVGPWHLAEDTDMEALSETFMGAAEFGSGMEITSKGNISWYVGAVGAAGSCTVEGNLLQALVTLEDETEAISVEITPNEDGTLTMTLRDIELTWIPGEGETLKGSD